MIFSPMSKPTPRPGTIKPADPRKKAGTVSMLLAWAIVAGCVVIATLYYGLSIVDFEDAGVLFLRGWLFVLPFIAAVGAVLSVARLAVVEIPKWKDISVLLIHSITLTFFVSNFASNAIFTDPLAKQRAGSDDAHGRLLGKVNEKTGIYESPNRSFRLDLKPIAKGLTIVDQYNEKEDRASLTLSTKEGIWNIETSPLKNEGYAPDISPEEFVDKISTASMKSKVLLNEKRPSPSGIASYRIIFESKTASGESVTTLIDHFGKDGTWYRLGTMTQANPDTAATIKKLENNIGVLWPLFSAEAAETGAQENDPAAAQEPPDQSARQ